MKVSGFTFARNAVIYDYPITEAISSLLQICDEVVVAVGNSEDDTLHLIESIASDKIKIINTIWDESNRSGGQLLSIETNKALDAIIKDSDWAFYLQADEIIHESDIDSIRSAMLMYKDDDAVDGLLFNYYHFYGSYDYLADSRQWYRKEIRIIKNDSAIRSYKDAMGFRKNGKKLRVKQIDAWIYHYGWVKHPKKQQSKQESFHKMWHNDKWITDNIPSKENFEYSEIDSLQPFEGTHPKIMQKRISEMNWDFNFHKDQIKRSQKEKLLYYIEQKTGWRVGEYKNYKIIS